MERALTECESWVDYKEHLQVVAIFHADKARMRGLKSASLPARDGMPSEGFLLDDRTGGTGCLVAAFLHNDRAFIERAVREHLAGTSIVFLSFQAKGDPSPYKVEAAEMLF